MDIFYFTIKLLIRIIEENNCMKEIKFGKIIKSNTQEP